MTAALIIWGLAFLAIVGVVLWHERKKPDVLPPSWRQQNDGDVFQDQLDRERAARRDRG